MKIGERYDDILIEDDENQPLEDQQPVNVPMSEVRHRFGNLSVQIRGRIVALAQSRWEENKIRDEIGCDIRTVRLWIRRFQERGDPGLADHRKNNRRPKKTAPDEDAAICAVVERTPFTTARQILVETGLNISRPTICRRLHEHNITDHRPLRKSPLLAPQREGRMTWAEAYRRWRRAQWRAVIFSDEKASTCLLIYLLTCLPCWKNLVNFD